jgi:hypothetical protein
MTHFEQHFQGRPLRARVVAAAAWPDASARRRRTALLAACAAALGVALLLPAGAHAGWPLDSAAPAALGFGETYAGADGTPSVHRGVDLVASAGSSVRSPLEGRVSFAGRVPAVGGGTVLAVTIATRDGSVTLLPLSSAGVKAGTELAEGDPVGVLGGEGDASSYGSHLHVGARKGDLYLDPLTLIAAPLPARADTPDPRANPAGQPSAGSAPAEHAVAPQASGVGVHESTAPAAQPAAAPAPSATALRAGVSVGARASAAVPGASVAPGVSIPGAVESGAVQGSTLQSVGTALSAALGSAGPSRSGQGSPASALVEWALGAASRGLLALGRVLAVALLALGALWPIWRSERRKGAGQLSVRPSSDDVAAVTGR